MSEPTPNEGGRAATLTKYAAFTPEAVHRSRINFAAYNPRRITEAARKKLRANLERVGLLEPIIWNRRTGNVVGGHQRLRCLDALEGHADYLVPVAAVELDDAQEKASNIFLNNGEAAGDWDLLKLAELLPDVPAVELTGFDHGDLFAMFGRDVMVERLPDFLTNPQPPEPEPREGLSIPPAAPAGPEGGSEGVSPPRQEQRWDEREQAAKEREPGDFFHVVVHKSDAARTAFEQALGLKPGRYIDPAVLLAKLKGG